MKKTVIFLLSLALIFSSSKTVFADDAVTKLGRGAENILTSPVEFVTQYEAAAEKGNPIAAVFETVLCGIGMTVVRIAGGAYEVVTFPIPLPKNYEALLDPETPLKALRQGN